MKALLSILSAITMSSSANGAIILLGGYDGTNAIGSPKQDSAAVGKFSFNMSYTGTIVNNKLNPGLFFNGGSLWGTSSFSVAADSSNNNNVMMADVHPVTLTFVVSNTGTQDIILDSIHWVAKRDRTTAPDTITLAYTAGDLSDTPGASGTRTLPSGTAGHDYALSNIVTDRTLSAGQSATFTWTTNDMDDRLRVDNIAFSGTIVPEPSAAMLLCIAGLGLALIRRR